MLRLLAIFEQTSRGSVQNMAEVILYTDETRDQFDERTRVVLDALKRWLVVVELHPPEEGGKPEWFVAVWKDGSDLPSGFFGKDPYSAALRVARAFGINIALNDTDPM